MTQTKATITPGGSAVMSSDGRYRYLLTRPIAGYQDTVCTFIMLNPSTANHEQDDPTIRRCIKFAERLHVTKLQVVNLFALRTPYPDRLEVESDPVGPDNKYWVDYALQDAKGPVIAAWGANGGFMEQDLTMMGWLDALGIEPECFEVLKNGHPKHPLYVRGTTPLIPYKGRRWDAKGKIAP